MGWIRILHVLSTANIWPLKGSTLLTTGFAAVRFRAAGQLAVFWLIFFAFQRFVAAAARAEWICGLVHSFCNARLDSCCIWEAQRAF